MIICARSRERERDRLLLCLENVWRSKSFAIYIASKSSAYTFGRGIEGRKSYFVGRYKVDAVF